MDWLNFGEVDLINAPPTPSHDEEDTLDMLTFLNDDFQGEDQSRLKSKNFETELSEISRHDISETRESFGDPQFQDNDVVDMYESFLSHEEVPSNPSDSPFFELDKVTEVVAAASYKTAPSFLDLGTRSFLEAIENFLSSKDRDINPSKALLSSRPGLLEPPDEEKQLQQQQLKNKKRKLSKHCDMMGGLVPKAERNEQPTEVGEDKAKPEDCIQLSKSSKDTFRIANISEFVDRANGRNIIILIADNHHSSPHDPGRQLSGSESFEISSSCNAHLQEGRESKELETTAKYTQLSPESLLSSPTGTQIQSLGSFSPRPLDSESAQEHNLSADLISFPPRMEGTSLTLTPSSSSSYLSSSSCSSSPKSFHFSNNNNNNSTDKSPQLILSGSQQQLDSLLLSPPASTPPSQEQIKQQLSPSSTPLPLVLPKRGKRTLQERRKIKKWQNIEAARRYRDRKKLEMETSISQVKTLEAVNKELYDRLDTLSNKVSNMKKILSRLGLHTS